MKVTRVFDVKSKFVHITPGLDHFLIILDLPAYKKKPVTRVDMKLYYKDFDIIKNRLNSFKQIIC